MKPSNPNGPAGPNDDRLIVAAEADNGWKLRFGLVLSDASVTGPETSGARFKGTTPSLP